MLELDLPKKGINHSTLLWRLHVRGLEPANYRSEHYREYRACCQYATTTPPLRCFVRPPQYSPPPKSAECFIAKAFRIGCAAWTDVSVTDLGSGTGVACFAVLVMSWMWLGLEGKEWLFAFVQLLEVTTCKGLLVPCGAGLQSKDPNRKNWLPSVLPLHHDGSTTVQLDLYTIID